MNKTETVRLAQKIARISVDFVGYDYVGLLIYQTVERVPEDADLPDDEAMRLIFEDFEKYVKRLDARDQRTLKVLQYHILYELTQSEPTHIDAISRYAVRVYRGVQETRTSSDWSGEPML